MIRVVTDHEKCAGNALCAGTAPTVFDVSDDGYVIVLDEHPTGDAGAMAHRAAVNCPTGAIALIEVAE
jgi:ferredoxin